MAHDVASLPTGEGAAALHASLGLRCGAGSNPRAPSCTPCAPCTPCAAPGCTDLIGADDAIGEAELNLKTLYDQALKKNATQLIERQWVSCTHPSYVGVRAQVCLTIELVTRDEAELRPAGKAREAPNENPHLNEPLRPSILDALGINLNFFNPFLMFKKHFVRFCICLILLGGVALVILLVSSD